jgi:Mg-chelatase subunit ChlD
MDRVPATAGGAEINVDLMVEESAAQLAWARGSGNAPLTSADIWVDFDVHRLHPVILCVDTSLSMTGEKLALTGVALAVVLLEFRDDPVGVVAFENEAFVLKEPGERISPEGMIERFLEVPARGYTHLEDGLGRALRMSGRIRSQDQGRPAATVLLSDGRFTAGRDPRYLAGRFPHLSVIKMGSERSGAELCRDLARPGRGSLREVADLQALPGVMYDVVKGLLRGRGTG